jgi:prephenate dehydrogenase
MFNRVCIVGIGLIGGSFGLALKKQGLAKEIIGVARRQSTLDEAIAMGACDGGTSDVVEAATAADLVFLAPPVGQMKSICEQIAPVVAPGAIVTDAGSTKDKIVAECEPVFMGRARFLGGHPMAGSEKTGATAARGDLYRNAAWILTPTVHTEANALQTMQYLVASLGARPIVLDASTHDELLAVTSHLPHVTAAALTHVFSVARTRNEATSSLVAGGWRDCTRVAAGSPEMWRDICLANRDAILRALDDLNLEINRFRAALSHENGAALGQWFEEAAGQRKSMN